MLKSSEIFEFSRENGSNGSNGSVPRRSNLSTLPWTDKSATLAGRGDEPSAGNEGMRPGMRASSEVAQERRTRKKLTLSCSSHIQEKLNFRARFPSVHGSSNASYGILILSNAI